MVSAVSKSGILAIAILFPLLDTAVVAARFYVRRLKKARLGIDDWSILAALVRENLSFKGIWTLKSLMLNLSASI